MPSQRLECQYKVCHRCHRHGQDKSWVSLDGVLKGEVLPTVAVGFSFSYMCARPVADANLVKNLGCRPVPLVSSSDFFQVAMLILASLEVTLQGSNSLRRRLSTMRERLRPARQPS